MKSYPRLFYALFFTTIFLLIIWGVYFIDIIYELGLTANGNRPRELRGLKGIVTFPFLHGSLSHIWNNTASFFVLNGLLFYFYRSLAVRVWVISFFASGILLWMFGGGGNHIGASGMVYALASFLFLSGIVRKNLLLLRVTLLVAFLYGGMVWLMLPLKEHVSWEGHLAGALSGAVLALYYRNMGPKNPIYKYELSEAADEDLPEWWMRGNPNHPDTIAQLAEIEEEKSPLIDQQTDSTRNGGFTYQWAARVNKKTNTKAKNKSKPKKQNQKPEQ
ncbi:MAG: rhomboid family intramembrane serine protease [Flavobacteriales bacterium]|nr:rhomboid family intramembrane serine protease [Flavobacteriales bacterium]